MERQIPEHFPLLPSNPNGWSANVLEAYEQVKHAFQHALTLLHQEDGEPIRLTLASEQVVNDMVPILEHMEGEGISPEFTHACAHTLGPLVFELKSAAMAAEGMDGHNVMFLDPVIERRTGEQGRPEKKIDNAFLAEAMSRKRNITIKALAKSLKMHRNTLSRKMKACGLTKKFDEISNADLDRLMGDFKLRKPNSGGRYAMGYMRKNGIRVQKRRVMNSLRRVDSLGRILRHHKTIHRRQYSVPRPNYLWHCDGHHKLIWWGIVIHGFIDGYCRTVTGLKASNNNRASTVLEVFLQAIQEYGAPSRMRGDRGGENTNVSVWMIMHQGPNRASFMWGSSTHNTRIERLWVEVGTQFCRRWRAFFIRLGHLHRLDRKKPSHLWLLHRLFLSDINDDCKEFQEQWNTHPVSGPQMHDHSPSDLRLLGQINKGVYTRDPTKGIHPETLNWYYGVEGEIQVRNSTQTGAGHPEDEGDEGNWDDEDEGNDMGVANAEEYVQNCIAEDQASNIRHASINVARHANPFQDSERIDENQFFAILEEVRRNGVIPDGYGVLECEWEGMAYPELEVINLGTRRGKEIVVALPKAIWLPRAILFVQGLDIMTRLMLIDDINEH